MSIIDGSQTTQWLYGVSTSTGSDVTSNDVLRAVRRPDPSSGSASSSEEEAYQVNRLGEVKASTDRNGTTLTYTRDVAGRVTADAVTTLGSGVDGAVRRVETAYDSAGMAYLFTSYDAASGGSVVNQVQRAYNGLGQLTREYQAVSGSVNTSTTPYVGYSYGEMAGGANHSRATGMTYPDGKALTFTYTTGLDSTISRLSSIVDTSGTLEEYSFLGLSTVVERKHPQPNVDLSYVKRSGESDGDAGDKYAGLDRFGRVVDQRWLNPGSGTAVDRFKYGYDRGSNRLHRENVLDSVFSELYQADGASAGYDALGQLIEFQRGVLSDSNSDGVWDTVATASRTQGWDLDSLGNWDSVTSDSTTQTRTHNRQNEITAVSGASTPTFSANGEMTGDEQGRTLKYDSWGRLVEVKQGSTVLSAYSHDALNRRVAEGSRTLYYSASWQVVEERASGVVVAQAVFSPVYVDGLILRDRDTDANGTLDERLWVLQDANWNVTALVNGSGAVVERYIYDPYGTPTVLTAAWGARTASLYAWKYLHQGGRFDADAGLYHFRNRDFSPTLGRWTRNDPIEFKAGDVNLYRSADNNTVTFVDPLGLSKTIIPKWLSDRGFTLDGGKCHNLGKPTALVELLLDVVNGNITECERLVELAKVLVMSNKTRGVDANPDYTHAARRYEESYLWQQVKNAFDKLKCPGKIPDLVYTVTPPRRLWIAGSPPTSAGYNPASEHTSWCQRAPCDDVGHVQT